MNAVLPRFIFGLYLPPLVLMKLLFAPPRTQRCDRVSANWLPSEPLASWLRPFLELALPAAPGGVRLALMKREDALVAESRWSIIPKRG